MPATAITRLDVLGPKTELPNEVACDATNGNSVVNDGNTDLVFDAGTAGGTVTFTTTATLYGQPVDDVVMTLTANKRYRVPASYLKAALFGTTLTFTASVNTIKVRAENVL